MPEVSIVIPVYNSGEYLIPCLESVLSQTLDSVEIVLVDDHGTDGSIGRAREFLKTYTGPKSFKFARTAVNSGPGAARNAALEVVSGNFIAFVDSDDTLSAEFCSTLLHLAGETGADLVCCDILFGDEVRRNADVSDRKRFLRKFVTYSTTYLYGRDLIERNGIRFPESSSAEDTCFLTCCVLSSRKMSQVHSPLYRCRLTSGSVSRRKNRRRAFERMKSVRALMSFARARGYCRTYWRELAVIYLKKGLGMALRDIVRG